MPYEHNSVYCVAAVGTMVYAGYQGSVQQCLINSSMYGAEVVIMMLHRTVCMCVVMGHMFCSTFTCSEYEAKVCCTEDGSAFLDFI